MTNVVLAPTDLMLQTADCLEKGVGAFLRLRTDVPPLGKYESEIEAVKLMNLAVRHCESIASLIKLDTVLAPSAYLLSRGVFEASLKAAWMVSPDDPFHREVRWLAHLEEDERTQKKIAERIAEFGGDPRQFVDRYEALHSFRTNVTNLLPPGYSARGGNPSVEQMLTDLGDKQMYPVYSVLSGFVHGCHAATWSYRRNLGAMKRHGEFTSQESWLIPLWVSWKSLYVLGSKVLMRLKVPLVNLESEDRDLCALLDRFVTEEAQFNVQ